MDLTVIPEHGHVPYAASLLRGNAALWWRELCESNHWPRNWEEFCCVLCSQFHPENFSDHDRDELARLHQYSKESVADFAFHFRVTCLKIADLSDVEKLDRFVRALVSVIRL